MELEDCGFDLLAAVVVTMDPSVAFANVDVVIGLGAFPRGPGTSFCLFARVTDVRVVGVHVQDLGLYNAPSFRHVGDGKEFVNKHRYGAEGSAC